MKCVNCGHDNSDVNKFCEECGFPVDNAPEAVTNDETYVSDNNKTAPSDGEEPFSKESFYSEENFEAVPQIKEEDEYDENNQYNEDNVYDNENSEDNELQSSENEPDSNEALENLRKFEEGTITHPNDKPQKKRKFYCPLNPMLFSFLLLLLFAAVLGVLSIFFFNVDLGGTQIVFGIVFTVLAAAVAVIDFAYYFPAALALDKLLKGKGAKLEYRLKNYELVELAETEKKRNRGFYIAISLFGLAFSIYYIYILANAMVKTNLMWISLFFSIGVFVIFTLLLFIMPKLNYERIMQNGERVIVGKNSVYYGGVYYHWRKIIPEATYGTLNTKKHRLEIVFLQEVKKGDTKRRKIEMYAPDSAIRDITRLLNEYEENAKKYRETQSKSQIVN